MSVLERDGYLHLQLEYWSKGALPDNDAQLARIAGMTPAQWRRVKPVIQALFNEGWKHRRLDSELARVAKASALNSARARKAANIRHGRDREAKAAVSNASSNPPSSALSMLGACYPRPAPPLKEARGAPPSLEESAASARVQDGEWNDEDSDDYKAWDRYLRKQHKKAQVGDFRPDGPGTLLRRGYWFPSKLPPNAEADAT